MSVKGSLTYLFLLRSLKKLTEANIQEKKSLVKCSYLMYNIPRFRSSDAVLLDLLDHMKILWYSSVIKFYYPRLREIFIRVLS